MELQGMQFDDVSSISNGLAGMLGKPAPEAASIRLGTAVSGGGGTGLAVVTVGTSLSSATVGCLCTIVHAAGERVVLMAQGPMLVCMGALVRETTAYAMAAGSLSLSAPAAVPGGVTSSIVFPTGRFSQPPRVVVNMESTAGTAPVFAMAAGVTNTGATVSTWQVAGASTARVLTWIAVQMTPTAASG